MEDGKTIWEMGKEQIGQTFKPLSICTDHKNSAYVADFGQNKIHLLLVSDGTVIKRFDVRSLYGIQNVFAVRFCDQHIYIEWKIIRRREVKRYAITKFKQIKEM